MNATRLNLHFQTRYGTLCTDCSWKDKHVRNSDFGILFRAQSCFCLPVHCIVLSVPPILCGFATAALGNVRSSVQYSLLTAQCLHTLAARLAVGQTTAARQQVQVSITSGLNSREPGDDCELHGAYSTTKSTCYALVERVVAGYPSGARLP